MSLAKQIDYKCAYCSFKPMIFNMMNYIRQNEQIFKSNPKFFVKIEESNKYKDFHFFKKFRTTEGIDKKYQDMKDFFNDFHNTYQSQNFSSIFYQFGQYTLPHLILEMHTQQYFQDYYQELYSQIDKIGFPEYRKLIQNIYFNLHLDKEESKKINEKFNDNFYDHELLQDNPYYDYSKPHFKMPFNRLISFCIYKYKGINDHVTTFKYTKFEPKIHKDVFYSIAPISTSFFYQNQWFNQILKKKYLLNIEDGKYKIYKLCFHLTHEDNMYSANLHSISTSKINEYELILSSNTTYNLIDKRDQFYDHKDGSPFKITTYNFMNTQNIYNHKICWPTHFNEYIQNLELEDRNHKFYYSIANIFKVFFILINHNYKML